MDVRPSLRTDSGSDTRAGSSDRAAVFRIAMFSSFGIVTSCVFTRFPSTSRAWGRSRGVSIRRGDGVTAAPSLAGDVGTACGGMDSLRGGRGGRCSEHWRLLEEEAGSCCAKTLGSVRPMVSKEKERTRGL